MQTTAIEDALAELSDSELFHLDCAAGEVQRAGYAWIRAAVNWEQRQRQRDECPQFPAHEIPKNDLSEAIGNLWAFAALIRANPDGAKLGRIVAVLDSAVAKLTADMEYLRHYRAE